MANTDKVTAAKRDMFVGDIKEQRPNSENVNAKLAGNIQFIIERLVNIDRIVIGGYFNANSFDDGAGGYIRIDNDCEVSSYHLAVRNSGTSGTNALNFRVYDNAGGFVNNLFTTAPSISGNNGTDVVIGKTGVDTTTPSNFTTNGAGHTINHGTLALGISTARLLAGYILVPFVESNGVKALNINFTLKTKEI